MAKPKSKRAYAIVKNGKMDPDVFVDKHVMLNKGEELWRVEVVPIKRL
jgi:hypothetical protein